MFTKCEKQMFMRILPLIFGFIFVSMELCHYAFFLCTVSRPCFSSSHGTCDSFYWNKSLIMGLWWQCLNYGEEKRSEYHSRWNLCHSFKGRHVTGDKSNKNGVRSSRCAPKCRHKSDPNSVNPTLVLLHLRRKAASFAAFSRGVFRRVALFTGIWTGRFLCAVRCVWCHVIDKSDCYHHIVATTDSLLKMA